jgi:hypothetical protein
MLATVLVAEDFSLMSELKPGDERLMPLVARIAREAMKMMDGEYYTHYSAGEAVNYHMRSVGGAEAILTRNGFPVDSNDEIGLLFLNEVLYGGAFSLVAISSGC